MNQIAFIFPGQGSQTVGMGVSLAERFPQAQAVFDEAGERLGWDLYKLCREGPEERLRQTDAAQTALYVTGYAAFKVLQAHALDPDAAAGHSIGEYAALACAGVFDFKEGLSLVCERGRLMREAARAHPGAMAAVLGLDAEAVRGCCAQAQAEGGVCAAVNFNSPEQVVIAGDSAAVQRASALATGQGAKRVIGLNVSAAFHSSFMSEAARSMREILRRVAFKDARIPVAMNVDGSLRRSGTEIQDLLARQLDSAVEWVKSVDSLKQYGCGAFVECGPGRVLGGLLRRIDRQLQAYSTETAEALGEAVQALALARKGTS